MDSDYSGSERGHPAVNPGRKQTNTRQRAPQQRKDIEAAERREKMMTREKCEVAITDHVMARLRGQDPSETKAQKPSAESERLAGEIKRIEKWGTELTSIGHSIEALIDLFNRKVEEELNHSDRLVNQSGTLYRECFQADIPRLEDLIQNEVEGRQELVQQQGEFDDFIKNKIESFMVAKKEMEEQFMENYKQAWMKKELMSTVPQVGEPWQPVVEKLPFFGKRPGARDFNFEWPQQFQVSNWPLNRKIKLQRISSTWTSLRSLQFHLTGNISSDEMCCQEKGQTEKEIIMNIAAPAIKQVHVKLTGQFQIYGLRFTYLTGDVHTLFEADGGLWKTKEIPQGKEIIGFYGNAHEERIYSLGFLLWTPKPDAI